MTITLLVNFDGVKFRVMTRMASFNNFRGEKFALSTAITGGCGPLTAYTSAHTRN